MALITLPQHILRRLLEHEEDILSPLQTARAQKYSAPCPRCKGALHQHLAEKPFSQDSVLPRTTARCVDCGCEIDTQSGIMIKMGNPAKVESPIPIINPKAD